MLRREIALGNVKSLNFAKVESHFELHTKLERVLDSDDGLPIKNCYVRSSQVQIGYKSRHDNL